MQRIILQFGGLAVLCGVAIGCRQTTVVADEHVSIDSDSDTGTDSDTHTDSETDTGTDTGDGCGVPEQFSWSLSDMIISPMDDTLSIKDPSVVFDVDRWYVYATSSRGGGNLNMTNFTVTDWSQAASAVKTAANTNPNLNSYKAAPQLFFFRPKQTWYLVYQTPEPAYSTSDNPEDVLSWSVMTQFMPMPSFLADNDEGGIDYWIICDDEYCYMFFSALNGGLYRVRTSIDDFPNGFDAETTEVVMYDSERLRLLDASNVYKIGGTDTYLLLVSAIGSIGRYFRAWTSDRLDGNGTSDEGGAWTPLAETEENSFASRNNVTGTYWPTGGILHGEMLRWNEDETMTIDSCNMQYLFTAEQIIEGDTDTEYYALGLLSDSR